jgi:putative two-component system response regulator
MEHRSVILVVDDQIQNVRLLQAHLQPQGYEILVANSGGEALEMIAGHPIDLVLLDVMMPGMDGFAVTRKIRQDPVHSLLPVVLVTSLSEKEDRVTGIDAGCDDFISKPVDRLELLARIKSLLKVKAYNDLMGRYRADLEAEVALRTGELKSALERNKEAALETIRRLTVASEYRDEDTGEHVIRMSRYAEAVARRMGLGADLVENILYAAPMHDVGKIGIPDGILLKPGKLDATEWEWMKQHAAIGARILTGSDAEYIRLGEIIAKTHHEKWDGSGYPEGLKGEAIPIAGRVTAIADVFDALSSKRPYKAAFPLEKSLAIIREGRGTHFDPGVVDAFEAISPEIKAIKEKFEDDDSPVMDPPKG